MDESDLINFKLNLKKRISELTHEQPVLTLGEWIEPGNVIEMGQWECDKGLFYYGHRLCGLDNYSTEPSLINPDSTVNYNTPNIMGYGMSYWPSYHTLSPESRAGYLKWLFGSRSEPDAYIGYVFIYFYGLERRVLIDKRDYTSIKAELLRLKSIYSHPSLQTHINHLLVYMNVLLEIYDWDEIMQTSEADLLSTPNYLNPWFNYILAQRVKNSTPLNSQISLLWYFNHPEVRLKTPVTRCRTYFENLFHIRFKELYPEGIIIKENKKRYRPEYQPTNLSLRGYRPNEIEDLPAVSRLKAPFNKVLEVANQVISELEPYSRYLGRTSDGSYNLLGLIHLPSELGPAIENSKFQILKDFLERSIRKSPLLRVEDLLSLYGLEEPEHFGNKQYKDLYRILKLTGYTPVPFPDHHTNKWSKTDYIGVIKGFPDLNSSTIHNYRLLGVSIVLYKLLPISTEHIVDKIIEIIDTIPLQDIERDILKTYLIWTGKTNSLQVNIKYIKSLPEHEKVIVSGLLVDLSLADGSISREKKEQLEKLYKRLEIKQEQLTRDIDERRVNNFALDRDILKIHEEETADVQQILENIFIDTDREESGIEEVRMEDTNMKGDEPDLKGISLEKSYFYLYNSIVEQEEWSHQEFSELCRELKLLPSGAIEVINDWSYDLVDAPLIEEGDPVFIDLDIYEEIKCILKG